MSRTAATTTPRLTHRVAAEAVGTGWLVLIGCGTAVLAGEDVGFAGVALAFGLAVVTMAYAVGHVSGGHFNPAVTLGLAIGRRFEWRDVPAYVVAQVAGGTAGAAILYVVASGRPGFTTADGFATNGFGADSPAGYSLLAVAVVEAVLTFGFLYVILGATHHRAPVGFAPLAIGLALTAIHLVSIPVSNTSVNPARSLAVAWFDPAALGQVWVFLAAPTVGALIAGVTFAVVTGVRRAGEDVDGTVESDSAR